MKKRTLFLLTLIIAMVVIIFYIESERTLPLEVKNETEDAVAMKQPMLMAEEKSAVELVTEQNLPEPVLDVDITASFNEAINAVAIGDSLTAGIGDESEQGGFIGIIDRSLNKENQVIHFQNLGVPGIRSDQLLSRLSLTEFQEAITEADIILLTIGANDIMKVVREEISHLQLDDFTLARASFESNLQQIVQQTRMLNDEAQLYLIGIYNPFEHYFTHIEELNLIVDSWNEISLAIAAEDEAITFIPIDDLFQDATVHVYAEDHFHPNYHGYYLISERVLNFIIEEDE